MRCTYELVDIIGRKRTHKSTYDDAYDLVETINEMDVLCVKTVSTPNEVMAAPREPSELAKKNDVDDEVNCGDALTSSADTTVTSFAPLKLNCSATCRRNSSVGICKRVETPGFTVSETVEDTSELSGPPLDNANGGATLTDISPCTVDRSRQSPPTNDISSNISSLCTPVRGT